MGKKRDKPVYLVAMQDINNMLVTEYGDDYFRNEYLITGQDVYSRESIIFNRQIGVHRVNKTIEYHIEGHKRCTKCLEIKPLSEYYKSNNRSLYGVRPRCKKCHNLK